MAQDLDRPAQTDRIIRALENAGFENIRALDKKDRLIVAYENRRYRYEITGFREVLASVAPYLEGAAPVSFIQENDGVPVRAVTASSPSFDLVPSDSIARYTVTGLNASIDVDDDWAALRRTPRHASSFGRLDLVIQPRIAAQLGNYSDAIQTQIGLVPELAATIMRGLSLRAQVVLPLLNELSEEGGYVRPGFVSVGQTIRFRPNTFVVVSGGYFSADRYGVDIQQRTYFYGGRLAVGARAGYTGLAGIRDGDWIQSSIGRLTGAFTLDYYVSRFTLLIRSSLERFVYEDFGWRMDVVRAFGEFQLGVFGLLSEGADNAGFSVVIPLFGRKYGRPGPIRVRPARTFKWEYRYRGFPYTGRRYETGHDLDKLWDGVFPTFFMPQSEPRF